MSNPTHPSASPGSAALSSLPRRPIREPALSARGSPSARAESASGACARRPFGSCPSAGVSSCAATPSPAAGSDR